LQNVYWLSGSVALCIPRFLLRDDMIIMKRIMTKF
jgi:hypothetical protein